MPIFKKRRTTPKIEIGMLSCTCGATVRAVRDIKARSLRRYANGLARSVLRPEWGKKKMEISTNLS